MLDFKDFLVVEHSNFSNQYVIQKNKIIDLIGSNKLITLGNYGEPEPIYTEKRITLINIINNKLNSVAVEKPTKLNLNELINRVNSIYIK